jgi:hypothetical protein
VTRQELESYLQQCVLGFCRINAARMRDDGVDEEQIRNLLNAQLPELISWHNSVLAYFDGEGLTRH